MRALDRLAQLHLVSEQHQILRRWPHGDQIGHGNLPGFVHEQVVQGAFRSGVDECEDRTANQHRQRIFLVQLAARRDIRKIRGKSRHIFFFLAGLDSIWMQTCGERRMPGFGKEDVDGPMTIRSDPDALAGAQQRCDDTRASVCFAGPRRPLQA